MLNDPLLFASGTDEVLLRVEDLHTFYDDSHILHGVSFQIRRGECLALLGRNGAGKTTTLRSIVGLTPARSGSTHFAGRCIDTLLTHQRVSMGLAYVPEGRGIFPSLTVAEHLRVAEWAARGRARDHAEMIELFPRLGERLENYGGQLSGGEQQMLALARALIARPQLMILDEPSEGLAPVIVDRITDILDEVKKSGVTLLLVEQNLSMAMALADRVVILSQGQIVFSGRPQELRDDPNLMRVHLGVT